MSTRGLGLLNTLLMIAANILSSIILAKLLSGVASVPSQEQIIAGAQLHK